MRTKLYRRTYKECSAPTRISVSNFPFAIAASGKTIYGGLGAKSKAATAKKLKYCTLTADCWPQSLDERSSHCSTKITWIIQSRIARFQALHWGVIILTPGHEKMASAKAPAMFRFRPARDLVRERIVPATQSAATRFVSRDSLREAVFL
jgi:hypothetical protein